jgi:Rrf2 family cysteine metabolism transcriptional repressor
MNFSVKSEYALQAVFDLASQRDSEPVKIADIAKRQHIPQKFLELILASLKQGGFVESRRGAEGGYRLAKPANEITVGAVLQFVEGSKTEAARNAKRQGATPFSDLWQRVDHARAEIIDHTTFAELVRSWKTAQGHYVANWEI